MFFYTHFLVLRHQWHSRWRDAKVNTIGYRIIGEEQLLDCGRSIDHHMTKDRSYHMTKMIIN